ncbi:MAG: GntR family transcriptional regulator [Bacteroidales bacterium]|nr:GntR family transcriptional regulator [Bacteroidales bacterium]MCF8391546.1 GntR family transcriptional regulator [Bacteroidales bacterium]
MDSKKSIPQYSKVYETLRKHIEQGEYADGDILPSENELCAIHEVARPTVRKALDILTNDGYIKKRQGLGSVVQSKPKGIGILSLSGTTTAVGQQNLITKVIVKPTVQPWPSEFIFKLSEIEKESGCIYFERLRLINNEPIFYDISYLPNLNLPRFTSKNLNNNSLFDTLRENYQIKVTGGEQKIKAILPDKLIQKQLEVDKNTPVVNLQRKIETSRINFNIYSILYCHTEKHELYGRF